MARKLDKVIEIGNDSYEVQATNADVAAVANKVGKSLTITKVNLDKSTTDVVFNGEANRSIEVVPASGGAFKGRITVENVGSSVTDEKSVLNWGEVKTKVVSHALEELKNYSAFYTWNGTALVSPSNVNIKGVSIVTGVEAAISTFAANNCATGNTNQLSAFLYISTDTHAIYFGTNKDADDYYLLSGSKSQEALKLATARKITTDLGKDAAEATFDGTADIKPRVTGVLDPVNGGTGSTTLSNITVGTANVLRDPTDGRKSAEAVDVIKNTSDIAKIISGETYAAKATAADNASKLNGQSASYYQKKITISTSSPSGGSEGDIWIVYK